MPMEAPPNMCAAIRSAPNLAPNHAPRLVLKLAPHPVPHLALNVAPHLALWLALAVVSSGARADVYKCAGDGPVPIYQEAPCAKGKELRNFQTDPPEITILPAPRASPPPAAAKTATVNDAKSTKDTKDTKPGKSSAAADASERKLIRPGMTQGEVLAKLGYPDMTTGGKNGAAARWTYMPAPGDPETITSVTLTKGAVTEIDRKIVRK
jgi:hypothetical protein